MFLFAILLLVPAVIALGSFVFTRGVTWKEFALQVVIQALVAGASAGIVSCQSTADTEIWNGVVASKSSEHVDCAHSYPCNPYPCNCDNKGNCSTCYATCHEHAYDVDWHVYTSNQETVDINRVDSQGVFEPPRFTAARIGEPTAVEHTYVNYIKAAPDTLFRHQGLTERYAGKLPAYPGDVVDYYRLDRFLPWGVAVDGARVWGEALSNVNARWGRASQANVIVVLVRDQPQEWFYALEQQWVGGKKNDIVLVVDVDDTLTPQWASVMCWTTEEIFRVQLRDIIMASGALTKDKLTHDLDAALPLFKRKPMADFQYLEAEITPSRMQWVITLIISLVIAVGLSWLFVTTDVFGDER